MPRRKKIIEETKPAVPGDEDILDVKEAAAYLHYTVAYLYKLMHLGKVPYYRPNGGKANFVKGELRAYLLRGRRAADYELEARAAAVAGAR